MITLNGKKFAQTEAEFINSLFETDGTCVGYAKTTKNNIFLTDHNKNRVGFINKHGVLGAARKLENGKYWYSYANCALVGAYESYTEERAEVHAVLKQTGII